MDFTESQLSKTYRYLLVVACTFTGGVEAYPTCTEKATEVSRVLAKEIIPGLGYLAASGQTTGLSSSARWPKAYLMQSG
jgi:hypothetical protein